jgi:Tfp pilus assembly protein PilV
LKPKDKDKSTFIPTLPNSEGPLLAKRLRFIPLEISKKLKRKAKFLVGFSLLEILVSLLILAVVITGIMSVFISSQRYIIRSRHRLQAANIARQILEDLYREVRQDTWDTGELRGNYSKSGSITLPGEPITYNWNFTVSNVTGYSYRRVTVNVSWNETSP